VRLLILGGTGRSLSTLVRTCLAKSGVQSDYYGTEPYLISDPNGICSLFDVLIDAQSTPWDITTAYNNFTMLAGKILTPSPWHIILSSIPYLVERINYPTPGIGNPLRSRATSTLTRQIYTSLIDILHHIGFTDNSASYVGGMSHQTMYVLNQNLSRDQIIEAYSRLISAYCFAQGNESFVDDSPFALLKAPILRQLPALNTRAIFLYRSLPLVLQSYLNTKWCPSSPDVAFHLLKGSINVDVLSDRNVCEVIDIHASCQQALQSHRSMLIHCAEWAHADPTLFLSHLRSIYIAGQPFELPSAIRFCRKYLSPTNFNELMALDQMLMELSVI
jgi:hypothetical protein